MEMQMEFIRRLPTPQELMEQFPIDDRVKKIKVERDKAIANIMTGKDNRFLLVIGPCSADNEEAVLDYVHRLVPVQEQVKDKIFIVPRSIRASRARSASATRACFISRTRRARKTCSAASSRSAR